MAPYQKTILSLANSRRPGGTCFAGKEFTNGQSSGWLRPVNSSNSGAISLQDRAYEDGNHADVLDIVRLTLKEPRAHDHHQEDHQIDPDYYWAKAGSATWQDVVNATDVVNGALWANEGSSFHGTNDKVTEATARKLTGSLYLIDPTNLYLDVGRESMFQGGTVRKVRARFTYNGHPYNFVVTDEVVEKEYFAKKDGSYRVPQARLSISLAEIKYGTAIKLAAAVITPDRALEE